MHSDVTERREVVVVGGGQAGLAIGHYLAQQGRDFTILDAAPQPAAAWRSRWDSLRLFTPVRFDSLPGRAFPGDPDDYPTKDDVADYLTGYARDFELPVELNSRVRAVRADGDGYRVELDDRVFGAGQVVIATGPFQVPRVPEFAARLQPGVVHMHSSEYRTPDALPPGPVLVVGGGNTGFQIAEELAPWHDVHLSIGSRQMPLPQTIFGRDAFRFLEATGLMSRPRDSRIGRRMQGRETLVGYSRRKLRRQHGVSMRARATRADRATVGFEDGSAMTVSSVIWATGFGLDHSWVHLPVFDEDGAAVHERGVTASPGLYFLGLPWLHTRGSALLGWVGADARHVADAIAARADGGPVPSAPPAPAHATRT